MKKIVLIAIATAFAATLGVAYAGEIGNGVSDFSGLATFETLGIHPVGSSAAIEGSAAGSIRNADPRELYNAITDFTGRENETSAMGQWEPGVMSRSSAEGSAAGSLREIARKPLNNAVTDFTGRDSETSSYE
jgi:hypothetical protein